MDFASWWKDWFSRHPLKSPSATDRPEYTAHVMARVRLAAHPAPAVRSWALRPRWALALATAAAGLLIVFHAVPRTNGQLARGVAQETELLAAVGEPLLEPPALGDVDALAEELELVDTFVLAEAPPDDEAWIQDTVQLLNQLDEELPEDGAAGPSDEEWMQELQTLDESDLAASS